ncbi:MAG: chromosome segregation protein SMC [Candidatus Woesearchaeota archaeon]
MTKILKLELKGFKSFAQKTEVPFGDTFNCVLGPNGSGKSNILDAVCFVLGKAGAKGLRAEKSANLIYNGGKTKKPSSSGEVSIYFDNESKIFGEEKIIKITRVIKKTGQSVYKINDETCTRQQILDLLSRAKINPDGYNIILQGDIVRLVEMSGTDRRGIVEEIAGINIYEEKKQKALRELKRVEEKISEAEIILAERKTYLKELREDRDKALKFKDLDNKIKRNKATIISKSMKEKDVLLESLNKKKENIEEDIKKLDEKIAANRDVISSKKEKIDELNKEVEEKGEKEQVELHKEVEKIKVDVALNKQRSESLDVELEKINSRRSELKESFKDISSKIKILEDSKKDFEKSIDSKKKDLEKINDKISQFREKNNMDNAIDIDKQIEEIDSKLEKKQEEVNALREKQQNVLREKDKLETKLQGIDEKIEKLLSLEKENKEGLEKLKNYKVEFKKVTTDLSKCLAEDSSLSGQQNTAHTKLLSRKEQFSKLRARSQSIREQAAGGAAISEILNLNMSGVHGLVSELGDVNSDHSLALEVAAGSRLKSIIVETDEVAAKCINHLKSSRSGIATFIPLNKIRSVEIAQGLRSLKSSGVVGLAVDLVNYNPKFKRAFEYIFGNTLVVQDISVARKIGVGKVRMVTLAGDLVETSGAMQGGHRTRSRGIGFAEKEVKEEMSKLEAEISDLETVLQNLNLKRKDNDELINRLREAKANFEGEIIKLEKTLRLDSDDVSSDKSEKKKLKDEIESLDNEIEDIISNVSDKNRELAGLKIEKQGLRDKINSLRNPALLAELTSYEQKKDELKDEISSLTLELKKSEAEASSIYGPEQENIQKIFKQLDKEEESFKDEKKELVSKIKIQESDLKEKERIQKEFYSKFKEVFNERNKLTDAINKLENDIMSFNEKIRSFEQRLNSVSIDIAKNKAELAGLNEEFEHYKDVEVYKNKPEEDIKREIREFEKMMDNFGAVNMRALEIYEKVENEYNKLNEKKENLTKEREDVLIMINEVDNKKKVLFMKTFDVVNHNFKEIFSMLSTKGSATLELDDVKDPFNGGLNIKVKLSGNKYMDIRSLSGGEKTMTALAFIFAVQEHEPAAFYVLDEVDAALDKKNSERLAKLVKEYSSRSQYIIISHNDGVISEADNLYGISMNEHGVSKVTTLKI